MRNKVAAAAVAALALLIPTACGGSAISPEEALRANRAVAGELGTGTGSGDGALTGTGDTGDLGTGMGDTGTGDGGSTGTGDTGDVGTGTGTGDTGTGGSGGTGGGSTGTGGGGSGGATSSVKAGSCTGFKNTTGITDSTITIGNSSDISGPVPGLFTSAQQGTKAYVAYFNATSDICGRKLKLVTEDSRTDAGADQQAYTKFCDSVFAAVGSMSAFDSGGAATAQKCGLPDMRTASVTATRTNCSTCFGAQATGPKEYSNEAYDFYVRHFPDAVKKGAFLYLNAGAAAENGQTQIAVAKKRGVTWLYTSPVDVAALNYGPYVQQMKSKGVEFVNYIGSYQHSVRLAKAMQAADYHPKVLAYDASVYDPGFLELGGSAVEGSYFFLNGRPVTDNQKEINLYKKWLQQVAPGAKPSFFGMFAWSAAKLFVEKATALGGKLTRASLVNQFRGVHKWTGGGAHGPMDVGGKHPPSCLRFFTVKGGKFVPFKGSKYVCSGYSKG